MSEDKVERAELRSNGCKQVGNGARIITRTEALRNGVWVFETRDFHRFETTQASLDPAPDRSRTTTPMRSNCGGGDPGLGARPGCCRSLV